MDPKSSLHFWVSFAVLIGFVTGLSSCESVRISGPEPSPFLGIEKTISSFYEIVHSNQFDRFDEVYAPQLETWYNKSNISLDSIIVSSKRYKAKYPITKYAVNWETCNWDKLDDGTFEVTYNLDYSCKSTELDNWLEFNIDVRLELSPDFHITSVHDDIKLRTKREYFDGDWNRLPSNNGAEYYRIIAYDDDDYPVGITRDYYLSGELQWEGVITEVGKADADSKYEGMCVWYNRNGSKSQQSDFTKGELVREIFWNDQGQITDERIHQGGAYKRVSVYEYYSSSDLKKETVVQFSPMSQHEIRCDERGACRRVVTENFNDFLVNNQWENIETWTAHDYGIINIEGNDESRPSTTSLFTNIPIGDNNFSFSAYMTYFDDNPTSSGGLLFGYYDFENYSVFLVHGSHYTVLKQYDGVEITHIPWTETDALQTGWNKLQLTKTNDEFHFIINGIYVDSFESFVLKSNNFGFFAPSSESAICAFSDFSFKEDIVETIDTPNYRQSAYSTGSGFIVDKSGVVMTNYHVVEGADRFEVTINGQSFPGRLGAIDIESDLALIHIESNDPQTRFMPLTFDMAAEPTGSEVFTLGYPLSNSLGSEVKFTEGTVSSQSGFRGSVSSYQVSIPIQPGNSGGAMFNDAGHVVGIVNACFTSAENVAYAIKSAIAMPILSGVTYSRTSASDSIPLRSIPQIINDVKPSIAFIKSY